MTSINSPTGLAGEPSSRRATDLASAVAGMPDLRDGKPTVADKKSLLNFINTRFEKDEPLTTKGKREVKKAAAKGIKGMSTKMVREIWCAVTVRTASST